MTLHLREPGLWAEMRRPVAAGLAALFLDRDGVVIEEKHYLHHLEEVALTDGAAALIARFNRAGLPVVLVTNQAGIGRGIFAWDAFAAVQDEMHAQLAAGGAYIDGVYACAYHADGKAPYALANHAWRKPNPGMLLAAAADLSLDLSRSTIVGDRAADLEAGQRAGLPGGTLVETGYGGQTAERMMAADLADRGFSVAYAPNLAGIQNDMLLANRPFAKGTANTLSASATARKT